jgi:heme exporter protein D
MVKVCALIFALAAAYAAIGNAIVYVWLARSGVKTSLFQGGNPLLLIRRCRESGHEKMARFAWTTVAAIAVAIIAGMVVSVWGRTDS